MPRRTITIGVYGAKSPEREAIRNREAARTLRRPHAEPLEVSPKPVETAGFKKQFANK